MTFKKGTYYTAIARAKDLVPGFRDAYVLFEERAVLDRLSESLANNYGRDVAHLSTYILEFALKSSNCSEIESKKSCIF